MQLMKNVLIGEVNAPIAASSSIDGNSDILDMSTWDGVLFVVAITDSVDTAVATLTVEANTANSDSGMVAITNAAATATSAANDDLNDQLLIVDVYRPTKRYVQAVLTSATANIAYGSTIAIRYRGSKAPVTVDSTVLDSAAVTG